jgi:hypothetical protein
MCVGDANILTEPLLQAVQLRGRRTHAIRLHREDRTLQVKVDGALFCDTLERVVKAEFSLQGHESRTSQPSIDARPSTSM